MAAPAELQLDVGLVDDDDWFDALVGINQRWLNSYARVHPSFDVSASFLERNSLWMNAHFQKHRMITSPLSKQAKSLLAQHQQVVLMRLRLGGAPQHKEAEYSTALVEPMAVLMFAASVDRCPEYQIILTLQLLVLLANDDAAAVVHACKVAAQGQLWQPNMFIYTLQKRHHDNDRIRDLAAELIRLFASEMPVSSPISIDSPRTEIEENEEAAMATDASAGPSSPVRAGKAHDARGNTLPLLGSPLKNGEMSPHRPTTTISSLYVDAPSPYSSKLILPIARPPASASDQARRSIIYSTPKEKAIAGDRKRRCLTPNIPEPTPPTQASASEDLSWLDGADSPPKSPTLPSASTAKKLVALSEKYSWNPECINSVSGFEWWWRSLPQHHTNLEPTQKLKMVTKAAVRLHTKGEWERAAELYLLALSMEINEEVAFRVRVNLGCAYEVGHVYTASEAEFRAALRLNPDDPYARFKLASALQQLGKLDDAKATFESVLDVYPQAEDHLKQVEEAREQQAKDAAAEEAALAACRTTRSPTKPGRRLHSRGSGQASSSTTSLPRLLHPTSPVSPAPSPRPPPTERRAPASNTTTHTAPTDLISCILARCQDKKVDLRATLELIDTMRTGTMRLKALVKLLAALCEMDEPNVHRWLPHEAVHVEAGGIVKYRVLLDAVASGAQKQRSQQESHAEKWTHLVETIKQEEAIFYSEEASKSHAADEANSATLRESKSKEHDESPVAPDVQVVAGSTLVPDDCVVHASTTGNDGPSARDLDMQTSSTQSSIEIPALDLEKLSKKPSSSSAAVITTDSAEPSPQQHQQQQPTSPVSARGDNGESYGYHSVSARLDEKREKARHDALLRAERSRVVARKQLHCLKALQEIAARARRHLAKQHEARGFLLSIGANAVQQCGVGARDPLLAPTSHSEEETLAMVDVDVEVGEEAEEEEADVPQVATLLLPTTPAESCAHLQQDQDAKRDAVGVSVLCQRVVDVAIEQATRNIVVAKGIEELQSLAVKFSLGGGSVPKPLLQVAVMVTHPSLEE